MFVNEQIWDKTNIIKEMNYDNNNFSILSNEIFDLNQKRYRIKSWFNILTNSDIKEQKSYATTYCEIIIDKEEHIYTKIPEINYLLLEYDQVIFNITFELIKITNIFKNPNIINDKESLNNSFVTKSINLDTFEIPKEYETYKKYFIFEPIVYIGGGLLGDFIQSISIINEKFINTGRKGILYISNRRVSFTNGLDNTYKDTYEIIINQSYIKDYYIYNNESFDVDLTLWRCNIIYNNPNAKYQNWHEVYKETFQMEWGKHQWINLPINNEWNDKIIINTTDYRWPYEIDFNLLNNLYHGKVIYVSFEDNQYNIFKQITNLEIEFYKPNSLYEFGIIINSCKLIAGSQSAPLSIANALHKDRILGRCQTDVHPVYGNFFIEKLDNLWMNMKYIV
jgi:hypothetical protein